MRFGVQRRTIGLCGWLGRIRGGSIDAFHVCRDGETVQKLQIPGCDEHTPLLSDAPGSVYAWTAVGLAHLRADPPGYDDYRLSRVYSPEGVFGRRVATAFSRQGYIVAVTCVEGPPQEYFLHLIDLPD